MNGAPLRIVMLRPRRVDAAGCATITGRYVSGEMTKLMADKLYVILVDMILPRGLPPARRPKLFHQRPTDHQACNNDGYTWLDREALQGGYLRPREVLLVYL